LNARARQSDVEERFGRKNILADDDWEVCFQGNLDIRLYTYVSEVSNDWERGILTILNVSRFLSDSEIPPHMSLPSPSLIHDIIPL
jgi:hypothetical protein